MYSAHSESSVLVAPTHVIHAKGREKRPSLESHWVFLISVSRASIGASLRVDGSASDYVQAAFASAYRLMSIPDSPEIRNPRNWLTGILLNKIRMARRKFALRRQVVSGGWPPEGTPVSDPHGRAANEPGYLVDGEDAFTWAMSRLPQDQRRVVELRLGNDMEMRDVAIALGITETCAQKRYARAMQFLREVMPPYE
ncbi:hypothetical protein GC170_19600 [bacterium]|nr:hypothetical protein [bacterium]